MVKITNFEAHQQVASGQMCQPLIMIMVITGVSHSLVRCDAV